MGFEKEKLIFYKKWFLIICDNFLKFNVFMGKDGVLYLLFYLYLKVKDIGEV